MTKIIYCTYINSFSNLKVDSLMIEIEDLATKQGEEEARKLKKKEEIKAINVDNLSQNERK